MIFGAGSQIVKYGFAAGRVSVLETRMVSAARIKRLIEAENLEEIHRILAETDYGPDLRAAENIDEVESALEAHLGRAYDVLRESRVPPEMERYFRSRYDFLNLRVLLKSGFGQQIAVALSPLGYLPAESAEALVQAAGFAGMPAHLQTAAREAIARYNAERRFEDIDVILDRRYYAYLLDMARQLRSKWIIAYTRLLLDLANGRITVRADRGLDIDGLLIDGGDIDRQLWASLRGGENMAEGLALFPPSELKDALLELAQRGMPVAEYDLAADNVAIDYLLGARRFNVGPERVFAYVAAREHEVKLVRLLISGHLSGLPPARLQERVSRIYE